MKRQLSGREVVLLAILLIIIVAGGYIFLYYTPMKDEAARLEADRISCEEQLVPALARIEEKKRMEQELKILEADPDSRELAPYDNQKAVMIELNAILQTTSQYSLSFSTVGTGKSDSLICRRISLNFTADSYDMAKQVLDDLHASMFRCMLDDLSISLGEGGNLASVAVTMVYFEYQ